MARIFVTGATGQVGNQMVRYLLSENKLSISTPKDIICLVRNPDKAAGLISMGVTIVKGDLLDNDTIIEAFSNGIEYVFHIAADININHTYEQMYPPNVVGTRLLLDAFVNNPKAKCFVFTSSIAVYDVEKKGLKEYHITEESNIGKPEGLPYNVTKRLAEAMVMDYQSNHPDKSFVITRLGPILGPGDRQFLPSIVLIMRYTFLPKLVNRGKFVMSLTSPLDVARAQVFLAESPKENAGEVFNIAQETINFREIMDIIANYYYKRPPRFSITYWFYKMLKPIIVFFHKLFPKMKILEIVLSPQTAKYLGSSYFFSSEKLKKKGFKFKLTPEEAISTGLADYDPNKELVKPNKRIMRKVNR